MKFLVEYDYKEFLLETQENYKSLDLVNGKKIVCYIPQNFETSIRLSSEFLLIYAPKLIKLKSLKNGAIKIFMRDYLIESDDGQIPIAKSSIVSICTLNEFYRKFYTGRYPDADYYQSELYYQKIMTRNVQKTEFVN